VSSADSNVLTGVEHTFDSAERPGWNRSRRSVLQSSSGPWLHCRTVTYTPLSSRGLGRRILSPETRVRIPVAVPHRKPSSGGVSVVDRRFHIGEIVAGGQRIGQRANSETAMARLTPLGRQLGRTPPGCDQPPWMPDECCFAWKAAVWIGPPPFAQRRSAGRPQLNRPLVRGAAEEYAHGPQSLG
jgi:hypothetical protein